MKVKTQTEIEDGVKALRNYLLKKNMRITPEHDNADRFLRDTFPGCVDNNLLKMHFLSPAPNDREFKVSVLSFLHEGQRIAYVVGSCEPKGCADDLCHVSLYSAYCMELFQEKVMRSDTDWDQYRKGIESKGTGPMHPVWQKWYQKHPKNIFACKK